MTQHDNRTSRASQSLRPRRATLLASVAGLGIAALVSGTSLYHPSPLTLDFASGRGRDNWAALGICRSCGTR